VHLQCQKVLDKVRLFRKTQLQVHATVIVVNHIIQRREAPVMIEAAFQARKDACQRSRPIDLVGRAARLEVIDADVAAL
jgi:hypothetical protein